MAIMKKFLRGPKSNGRRKPPGSTLPELPLALTIMFLCLLMPLIDLATMTLRGTFVFSAALQAAHTAARANTYTQARTLASEQVAKVGRAISGVQIKQIRATIIESPRSSPSRFKTYTQALPDDAAMADKLYQLEIAVDAEIDPLVHVQLPFSDAQVRGLNAPFPISVSSRRFVENPDGLSM